MKKKVLTWLLTAAMCITQIMPCFAITVYAAGNPKVTVTTAAGKPGDTVEVQLELSNNVEPGLFALKVEVGYDSDCLELKSLKGNFYGKKNNLNLFDGQMAVLTDLTVNPIPIFLEGGIMDNYTEEGVFAKLEFEIKSGAYNSTSDLTVRIADNEPKNVVRLLDKTLPETDPGYMENPDLDFVNGSVTITGGTDKPKNEYTGEIPSAPTVSNVTATSFDVEVPEKNEFTYSKTAITGTGFDSCTWYTNGKVTGLTPNTTYYIYQRVKETTTVKPSSASDAAVETTKKLAVTDVIDGVSIGTTGTAGTVLTPVITYKTGYSASDLGTITYSWSNSTTDSTYTITAADVTAETKLYVNVGGTNITGTKKSNEVTAGKEPNTDTPVKPTVTATADGFTITPQADYEYCYSDTNTLPATPAWAAASTVTGKTPGTTWYVWGRIAGTATKNPSAVSEAVSVRIPGNDAALKSLSVSKGTMTPAFAADTTSYSVVVPYGTAISSIATPDYVKNDANATATVTKTAASYEAPDNVTEITVTAENGKVTKTYTITYSEINAVLSDLKLNGTTISGFSPDKTEYTKELTYAEWSSDKNATYQITATAAKSTAAVTISDTTAFTLSCSDPDATLAKSVTVTVEDTANSETSTYTVTFKVLACTHADKNETVVTEPDCTNAGSKNVVCNTCGKDFGTEVIPANGHTWGAWTKVDDTYSEHTCSVCNTTEQKKTSEIHTHTYNGKSEIITPATCKKTGLRKVYCSFDGCNEYKEETIPKAAHTAGTPVIVNATCTEDGSKTVKCTVCGEVISTDTIPAAGHEYNSEWESNASGHWNVCGVCGDKTNVTEHTENGVVTIPSTTESEGLMTYSCSVCGYVIRTERLKKLDPVHIHNFDTNWTTDAEYHWHVCDCGETSDKSSHVSDGGKVTVEATTSATGIREYRCKDCGYLIRTETIPVISGGSDSDSSSDSGSNSGYNDDYGSYAPVGSGSVSTPTDVDRSYVYYPKLNIKSVKKNGDSVTISWKKNNKAESYTVFELKDGEYVEIANTKKTSIKITKLENDKTYKYIIRYTVKGQLSPEKTATAVTVTVNYKPAVKATATKNSVSLKWKKVSGAKKYAIYKIVDGKKIKVKETTKLGATIAGLNSKTKYQYAVSAYINDEWTEITDDDIISVKTK